MPGGRGSGEQQEQEDAEREVEALGDLGTRTFASGAPTTRPLTTRPLTTRPLALPSPPRGGEGKGGERGPAQALTVGQVLSIQV